jgi:hypothetical protein
VGRRSTLSLLKCCFSGDAARRLRRWSLDVSVTATKVDVQFEYRGRALLQFWVLVAIPAGIPSLPGYRVRMARVSARWRNGDETGWFYQRVIFSVTEPAIDLA